MARQTITLTYGDVCENHAGMEMIGNLAKQGLSCESLREIASKHPDRCEVIELGGSGKPEACLLVIRDGVNWMLDDRYAELLAEQAGLDPDTKAYMRGRVVNKQARYNLCFSKSSHDPDYENGKGTVIGFDRVPLTTMLKHRLEKLFDTDYLQCEGNYYFNLNRANVGIGYHGDGERRVVIGVRLGCEMPISYQWYYQFDRVGEPMQVMLRGGDIYAMSEKAVGFDWKRSSIYTLRHAAGSIAFIDRETRRIDKLLADRAERRTPKKVEIDMEEVIAD